MILERLRALEDAVNQSSFNQEDLRSFEVRVPPLRLQKTYENLEARIGMSEKRIAARLQSSDVLHKALSHRIFGAVDYSAGQVF